MTLRESSEFPDADEVRSAERQLEVSGRACGRCSWVCRNPHPGMYELQVVLHAARHDQIEAMDDAELCRVYAFTEVSGNEFDNRIGDAELWRRGIDPLTVPPIRFQVSS